MISNYADLQETLGYAMDSEGASQEQFNKTLDSLQSKLNNLSNAWTEFTTGILNQDVIKFGVDALTQILNLINDITSALGSGGSTISKVLLTFGALRYGTGAAGTGLKFLKIDNHLPTLGKQWNTGLGGAISSFGKALSATKQGISGVRAIQLASGQFINATTGEDVGNVVKVGEAFFEAGNQAMTAGQKVKVFWGALSGVGKASIVITGILALVTVIQLLAKVIKTTKERAQEFQETLSELQNINKEIQDLERTLSDLRAYKEGVKDSSGITVDGMDDFATLQKGVGSYGQNISLTNEQYSRYLEICDAIVALNPDIAEGYDSNAEAIARNSSALDELIAKQERQIHNKAIQQAIDMDTEFYKNAAGQAKENSQELESATRNLEALYNASFTSPAEAGVNLFDALALDSILGDAADTPKKILEKYNDLRDQIYNSEKDSNSIKKAIRALDTFYNYYSTKEANLQEQIELNKSAIEEQTDAVKEQWISILPSIDGWYELSDAQQSFVEKYVRGLDIDLTNPTSMESQENEIKKRVAKMQEILNGEPIELTVTLPGEDGKTWFLKNIIETLGSRKFEELGMKAGLAWLNSFYQAILGITDPKVQDALMAALGFDGSWEDFGKLGANGFAEQIYGSSYTDKVSNMKKFATERAEVEYGRDISPQDFEVEYSDWYNWLAELDGDTADIIMNHWDELGNYLTSKEGPLSKQNAELAAQRYQENQKFVNETIKKGVDRGLDEERIKNYINFLQKVGSEQLHNNQALAAYVALRAMLYDQAVENVNTNLDSWKQASERSEMNPEEWANAQFEARQALADLLTVDIEDLPENLEITADMLDEIGKLAKGDTKAFQKMVKTIAKKKITDFGIDFDKMNDKAKDAWSEFEKLSDELTQKSADVAIGTSLDDAGLTDYANKMTKALLDVGLTAEQVGEVMSTALSGQGYEPEIEIIDVKAGQRYTIPTVPAFYKDPLTGEITTGGITGGEGVAEKDMSIIAINGSATIKNRDVGGKTPSGGGGGGGNKTPTKPKQDPFYNYIKTVDDYKKHLESLQDVQELLTKPLDIYNNTKAQEDYYKTLLGSNQSYLNHVNSELERLQKEAQSKYAKYIEVSIDGSLRLTEQYWASTGDITEELDEWIDAYDDVLGRQKDLTDEINDYKKELKDLWEGWRDSFIDLTNDIADVYQELDEKQLEDRQEMYEKMEEQDQRYLESVRNNIEEERKARERANSFEDLQKKQNRLALLQRDSSGRYANDIAELQEEINSDQQDLADQNVDNILDTLEKQMDKDAERHQDILDAMQKQIDSNVENRIYIERAEQTIAQGEQAILDAIHMGEDWNNASNAEREKMDEEQATNIAGSRNYLEKLNEGITSSSEYISKMVTDALTKQTESLIWTIGDIPQNDEAHVSHAMETTLPSILEQFFARTTTAEDMANDNKVSGARYASGGLVDYTGPAWVDGTPGKPEAFLNANQTAMIAAFTSNLAKMISGKFPSTDMDAGSNCEINIEIGSIGADYDIDQAINKVKQEIVNSAQFRNVTLLNRRR